MQTNFPSHETPLFPELDQLFNEIHSQWETEIQALTVPAPQIQSLATPDPIRTVKTSSRSPLLTPSRKRKTRRRQNFRLSLPNPKLMAKTAAGLLLVSSAVSGFQWLKAQQNSTPTQKIRRVMAQNTQTKVAAFRKEVAEGNHFMTESDKPVQYIVQEGDTVSKLARKFHVNPNTIIKNNDRKKLKADRMKPGTRLTILPMDGIAHPVEKGETIAELAKRYKKPVEEIIEVNDLDNPHMIVENQKLIIPNAVELRRRPHEKPHVASTSRNGKSNPAAGHSYAKTGNRLSWPSAGIVTSNFGWRWFRMHSGMDVAAPVGTPIRAAKEGRVVYSGWMGGYGYAVDVDHGNGIMTRYAHCSELHVQVGQKIYRGQVLAAMGSTGHSTGPHLHFEVHVNGQQVNPRGYF